MKRRELRAFLGPEDFGRDLQGELVSDEEGYRAAVQQLRATQVQHLICQQ